MIQIPFNTYPSFSQEVVLDENNYILEFNWNTRGEFWELSILAPDSAVILGGIKLVIGYDLFRQYKHLNIPKGVLIVVDTSENYEKIQYSDFSNDRKLQLIYVGVDEL